MKISVRELKRIVREAAQASRGSSANARDVLIRACRLERGTSEQRVAQALEIVAAAAPERVSSRVRELVTDLRLLAYDLKRGSRFADDMAEQHDRKMDELRALLATLD